MSLLLMLQYLANMFALFFTSLMNLQTSVTTVFGKEVNKKSPRYSEVVLYTLLTFTVPFWDGEGVPEMWLYFRFIYWYSAITCFFLQSFHHSNQNIKTNSYNDLHLLCHCMSFPIYITHNTFSTHSIQGQNWLPLLV